MTESSNPFQKYVQHRLEVMARADAEAQENSMKQGVTLRLNPPIVRLADALATRLDESRQSLLLEIVTDGLYQVAQAYADSHGENAAEVYRELMLSKDTPVEGE